VLCNNITLVGQSNNTSHLVSVHFGGTLVMNEGARITSNSITSATNHNNAGGVMVMTGGIFIMQGGEISGNSARSSPFPPSGLIFQGGGGVFLSGGIFQISNGIIYGSNAAVGLRNTTTGGFGSSTLRITSGTAEHGTFSNSTFSSLGNLSNTDNTIRVVNGVLQ
jgi:hypothetical protein